jgi:Holliday junction resolvase
MNKAVFHVSLLLQTWSYSWAQFGREAEFVITIYLKLRGWKIEQLSKGSKGPADIIASNETTRWFIQVKSSTGLPRLKGYEVKRLKELAETSSGLPVIAILCPIELYNASSEANKELDYANLGNYAIYFYSLHDWKRILPSQK